MTIQQLDVIEGTLIDVWQVTTEPSSFPQGVAYAQGADTLTYGTLECCLNQGKRQIPVALHGEWTKGQQITGLFDQLDNGNHILYPVEPSDRFNPVSARQLAEARIAHYERRTMETCKAGLAF